MDQETSPTWQKRVKLASLGRLLATLPMETCV